MDVTCVERGSVLRENARGHIESRGVTWGHMGSVRALVRMSFLLTNSSMPSAESSRPYPERFHAAEGELGGGLCRVVDEDHAGVELVGDMSGASDVLTEDAAAQTEGGVVGESDRGSFIRDAINDGDGAEEFFVRTGRTGRQIGEDGGFEERFAQVAE